MKLDVTVSAPPHIKDSITTRSAMLDVVIALTPAVLASAFFFGLNALLVIASAVIFAMISEVLVRRLLGKAPKINDLSAVVTGILLALTLPPTTPWWMVAVGAFVAIGVAKELFGGLGANIFNPALIGRAFLVSSWAVFLTTWIEPFWWRAASFFDFAWAEAAVRDLEFVSLAAGRLDGVSSATPLALVKPGAELVEPLPGYAALFLGSVGGSLGETSAVALLIGGLYLMYRGHITWHTPVSYIGTVAVLSAFLGNDPLYHILAGGLFLGAFFMATDWVTTPMTANGKLIFGVGAGVLVVLIRQWGGYPEGVAYSILLMNAFTPIIDKYVRPRRFGQVSQR